MTSFLCAIAALLVGYLLYGSVVERCFGVDPARKTPATELADGVDFVPLSWPRIFLIQFLNIAGLGPIFGAVLGALTDRLPSSGLSSAVFLPVAFMTSSLE